jgi:hypothetical protein
LQAGSRVSRPGAALESQGHRYLSTRWRRTQMVRTSYIE